MRHASRNRLDPDIVRAANALIENYGRNAARVAEKRAANLPGHTPDMAARTWRRIAQTVRTLQILSRIRSAA